VGEKQSSTPLLLLSKRVRDARGFDDMREEYFEDEDQAPFEDYASDNAGDPEDDVEESVLGLEELICRAVYTSTNSTISRIC
jgi:hypothetical protein